MQCAAAKSPQSHPLDRASPGCDAAVLFDSLPSEESVVPMSRLRRQSHCAPSYRVAAEVLEARSLLSAGAAAAHAALHAAGTHQAPHPAAQIPVQAFHGSVIGQVSPGADTPTLYPFKLSVSTINVAVNAKVTVQASYSLKILGTSVTFKATYTGVIQSFATVGEVTKIQLSPTGGSFTETVKTPGKPIETASAFSNGSPMQINVAGAQFFEFQATDVFPPSAPGGLANEPLAFDAKLFV